MGKLNTIKFNPANQWLLTFKLIYHKFTNFFLKEKQTYIISNHSTTNTLRLGCRESIYYIAKQQTYHKIPNRTLKVAIHTTYKNDVSGELAVALIDIDWRNGSSDWSKLHDYSYGYRGMTFLDKIEVWHVWGTTINELINMFFRHILNIFGHNMFI